MYSKDQASKLKQEFWTTFGQYLALELSSEDLRVNWVNYKTGIKHLYFKMQADQKTASIAIEMAHPDAAIQELLFEQFKEFKTILTSYLEEEWDWQLHTVDEYGKTVTRISIGITSVNIFKKEDWPTLISFLKPRIMKLDEFWNDAKHSFNLFS
ncbi:MAG: DUF4268 domain-containing protein [Pedobacter sp.]|nr:MAG: DUF4268 domain-containing protein [Pedobacter sp.]